MPAAITYRNESEMLLALRNHFAKPEYVLLPQVRNGAGFSATRTADALAMSVWPSRGLGLYGIEIKVSRGDWLREKKNPQKADEVARFCDYWMIAAGNESIVQDGELPENWGLLVPGKKPGTLRIKTAPDKLQAEPISRSFLACILKGAFEVAVPLGEVDAEIKRRVAEEVESIRESTREQIMRETGSKVLSDKVKAYEEAHEAFRKACGIDFLSSTPGSFGHIGKVISLLRWGGLEDWLDQALRSLQNAQKNINEVRKVLPKKAGVEETAA